MCQQRTRYFIINSNTQTIRALYLYAAGQNNEQIRKLRDLSIHSLSISYAKYRKFDSHKIHHSVSDYDIFSWGNSPQWTTASSLLRLHDHTRLDTPHFVGFLWTSDRPQVQTSTRKHTTLTRDKRACPRRDSNPQSQHASGRRPMP